jgi:hypothetical protein
MKKTWMFSIALSIITVLTGTFAAAQYESVKNAMANALGALAGILGGTVDVLITIPLKVLFFVMLTLVFYRGSLELTSHKPVFAWIIAIIVSAIGVRALPDNWLTVFLATYGAIAAAVIIVVPILILWFFSKRFVNTPLFMPIWITAGVAFLFLAFSSGFGIQEFKTNTFAALCMFAAIISLIVVLNKRGLRSAINDSYRAERAHLQTLLDESRAEYNNARERGETDRMQSIQRKAERLKLEIREIDSVLIHH